MGKLRLLFIHGSESNSQTYKATILRGYFPDIIVPDFNGTIEQRMTQLDAVVGESSGWTIIGSSLGGLMASIFAFRASDQVQRLILMAPALVLPEFNECLGDQIIVPTIIIHGRQDEVVPFESVKILAVKVFSNLAYYEVEDDHRLHKTAESLDWSHLLE